MFSNPKSSSRVLDHYLYDSNCSETKLWWGVARVSIRSRSCRSPKSSLLSAQVARRGSVWSSGVGQCTRAQQRPPQRTSGSESGQRRRDTKHSARAVARTEATLQAFTQEYCHSQGRYKGERQSSTPQRTPYYILMMMSAVVLA